MKLFTLLVLFAILQNSLSLEAIDWKRIYFGEFDLETDEDDGDPNDPQWKNDLMDQNIDLVLKYLDSMSKGYSLSGFKLSDCYVNCTKQKGLTLMPAYILELNQCFKLGHRISASMCCNVVNGEFIKWCK